MRRQTLALAAAAVLVLSGGAAWADCSADLAAMREGVSKDGGLAPMPEARPTPQTPDSQSHETGGAMAPTGGAAKDGTQMPLAADPDVATSAEDAQAQQQGGSTAAEVAGGAGGGATGDGEMGDARAKALEEAQAALDAGDEAGCMDALERARG